MARGTWSRSTDRRVLAALRVLAGGLLLWFAATGIALAADPVPPRTSGEASAPVPLRIDNRTVFVFRAPFGAFGPEERAQAARARIREIVSRGGPLEVSVERQADLTMVLIDGLPAFGILAGDVNPLLGQTPQGLAEETVKALRDAAAAYQEQRTPAAVWRGALFAVGATAAYLLAVWGLVKVRRAGARRIQRWVDSAVDHVRGPLGRALSPQALGGIGAVVVALAAWGLMLVASYVWVTFALAQFPYTRPWALQLRGFLLETAAELALAIAHSIPDLIVAAVIVVITRALTGVVTAFFERIEKGRIEVGLFDAFSAPMTRRLVNAALWLFAFAMAYPYLPGSGTDAFKGVSVLVGLMVSIGASSVVGQAASGLILTYSRTFKPGEFVRIGDTEGTLTAVGLFTTRVESGLGELIVIPNSVVLAQTTKNYSRARPGAGFVMDATVTIGYATPWRQVHAMLVEAARRTPGIASDPAPRVAQTELTDFYVAYRLICYALPEQARQRAALLSDLHAAIQDVFNENGVQIMSPHYIADPQQPQVVPKSRWFTPPAEPPGAAGSRG